MVYRWRVPNSKPVNFSDECDWQVGGNGGRGEIGGEGSEEEKGDNHSEEGYRGSGRDGGDGRNGGKYTLRKIHFAKNTLSKNTV